MRKAKFRGTIKDGKEQYLFPAQRDAFLSQFEGKEFEETIGPPELDQTKEQRGYYWGLICQGYAEEQGDTKEGVHEDLRQFCPVVVRPNGRTRIKSTSEMTLYEYSRYIDRVIIELAKSGYVVEHCDRNWNRTGWYKPKKPNTKAKAG